MLHIDSLTFSFEHRRLFEGISLRALPGDLIHLRGPNGAGKSTFLSILAGLRHPDAGQITFQRDGHLVSDLREVCAWLPPGANGLYLKMDATENLLFWSRMRGYQPSSEEITKALAHWGLSHPLLRKNFPVSQFSTGMRRRLGLARLSLARAPCWLLDEPVYGLDERGISLFQDCLRQHLEQQGIAIVVSHDKSALGDLQPVSLSLSPDTAREEIPS